MVSGFREKILTAHWFPSVEDKVLCEKIVSTCLVPYHLEPEQRMRALLEIYTALDGSTSARSPLSALIATFKDQARIRCLCRELLEQHNREETAADRDATIQFLLRKLSKEFPEPPRAHEQLKELYQCLCEEPEVLHILQYILGTEYTCKGVEARVKEILGRCQALAAFPNVRPVMTQLLERTAPLTLDTAAMEHLVRMVGTLLKGHELPGLQGDAERNLSRALNLLFHLSACFPYCLETPKTIRLVLDFLHSGKEQAELAAVQILRNVLFDAVKAERLASIQSLTQPMAKEMEKLVLSTSQGRVAKKAVEVLGQLKGKGSPERVSCFLGLFAKLEPEVRMESRRVIPALAAMGKMGALEPQEMSEQMKELISTKVVKPIILSAEDHEAEESEDGWVSKERLSRQAQAKVGGMKLMVRWLAGLRSTEDGYAERTLKMLTTVLETGGDLNQGNGFVPEAEKASLRLVAGVQMLRLALVSVFRPLFAVESFLLLAGLLADERIWVCRLLARKLAQRVRTGHLPVEWLGLLPLGALYELPAEATPSLRQVARRYVAEELPSHIAEIVSFRRALLRRQPSNPHLKSWQWSKLELAVAATTYFLSRHPRLVSHSDLDALAQFRDALWLLLKGVLIRDAAAAGEASNVENVYRLFQTVKDCLDAAALDDVAQNQKLWALCDVGMMLVQYRSPSFSFMKASQKLDIAKAYPAFFAPSPQFKSGNMRVYMPPSLLDDEKRIVAGHRAAQGLTKPRTASEPDKSMRKAALNVSKASLPNTSLNKSARKRARKASESGENGEDADDTLVAASTSSDSFKATPKKKPKARSSASKQTPSASAKPTASAKKQTPKTTISGKKASSAGKKTATKSPRLSINSPQATSTPRSPPKPATKDSRSKTPVSPSKLKSPALRPARRGRKSADQMPPPPVARKATGRRQISSSSSSSDHSPASKKKTPQPPKGTRRSLRSRK